MTKNTNIFLTYSFKIFICVALVAAADWLFYRQPIGVNIAVFAGLLFAALALVHPTLIKTTNSRIVAGLTIGSIFALVYAPGYLPLFMFAFCLVTLLVMRRRLTWPDFSQLVVYCFQSVGNVFNRFSRDNRSINALLLKRPRAQGVNWSRNLMLALVPVLLGVSFIYLFASANPLVGRLMGGIFNGRLDEFLISLISFWRWMLWLFAWLFVWSLLRAGYYAVIGLEHNVSAEKLAVWFSPKSVLLSLAVFNLMFVLQNGMDVFYLWSGQELPAGMSYAAYARAGAYPLVFTALLAGWYVLTVFGQHQAIYRSRTTDSLLFLWLAQNVFLMFSAMWRLNSYVEVYSLTYLRVSAFIWMMLVALGFVFIVVRLLTNRSNKWLLNANALVLGVVLYACCFVNFPAIIAKYNVVHSLEISGDGRQLDLGYIHELGPEALPALEHYLANVKPESFSRSYDYAQNTQKILLIEQQAWRSNWRYFALRDYLSAQGR